MGSSTAFTSPHSCDFCQNLVLYQRDFEWWTGALGDSQDVEAHIEGILSMRARNWLLGKMPLELSESDAPRQLMEYAVFDCTFEEARIAAHAGCTFCLAIIDHSSRPDRYDQDFLAGSLSSGSFGSLIFDKGNLGKRHAMRFNCHRHFEILAQLDNPASRDILTRPINLAPSSKESFHQVQEWRKECLERHQACPKPTGRFMPTRVLEIVKRAGRKNAQLCLRETSTARSTIKEPYAALSYCWGGRQQVTTTNDSYPRHSVIIDQRALPASVKDAVLVAENFGIKYLWVDAFCILQDDENDKNWEIVQMPLIYSQATVTIVASRARAADDGFLHERPRMGADTPDQVFKLAMRCSDNTLGSVVLMPNIHPSTEPLDLRAWPLQERFLSQRIIEYGSLQTRWICQTLSGTNSPIDGFKSMSVNNNERSDDLFTTALQNILSPSESITSDKRRKDLLYCWNRMLIVYTHRALTLGTDRLPAISGIAAHFGKSLCDEYKAGLWRSNIESQLLWKRYSAEPPIFRPPEYQGPSWSWAAINGPITPKTRGGWDENLHVNLEVLDYIIDYPSASANASVYNPSFGAVKFGSLEIRGKLCRVECIYGKGTYGGDEYQWFFEKKDDLRPEGKLDAVCHLDALEPEFADRVSGFMPAFLMVVLGPVSEGLILRHIESSKYSRLGVFAFQHWERDTAQVKQQIEWLNSSPTESITLI